MHLQEDPPCCNSSSCSRRTRWPRCGSLTGTPSDETGETEVDPASWWVYTIEVEADTSRSGQIKLLRPAAWLAENEVGVDKSGSVWVNLNIPGWGLDGLAKVLAIEPCPDIKPGPGRVVLMKSITLYRGEMAKVQFEGFATPLEGTSSHPVFSLDRGDFVPLGSLEPCERVRTADGWAVVESMARGWGEATVYNLEVEGEHQYLAGDARVVSHNDNATGQRGCYIVTPNGTVLPPGSHNIVPVEKPANGGGWFAIHNGAGSHGGMDVHTHYPEPHNTGFNRRTRVTTAEDIDYLDRALREGTHRCRRSFDDRGGP